MKKLILVKVLVGFGSFLRDEKKENLLLSEILWEVQLASEIPSLQSREQFNERGDFCFLLYFRMMVSKPFHTSIIYPTTTT